MSTPCYIGIYGKNNPYNGTIKAIYCHWDGYPEHQCPILTKNYDTETKVNELINLGNISSLGPKIKPSTKSHSFDKPEPNVVVSYVRDRGDSFKDEAPVICKTKKEFRKNFGGYAYLFDVDKNEWFIVTSSRIIKIPDKYKSSVY